MKHLLGLIMTFLSIISANTQTVQSITVCFNPNDYNFNNAEGFIESANNNAVYEEDTTLPALPFVPIQVQLPMGYTYSSFNYSDVNQIFATGVTLANNVEYISTDSVTIHSLSKTANYPRGTYPANNVKFTGVSNFGDCIVANFLICPWIYNSSTGLLEIMTSITINISLDLYDSSASVTRESALSSYLNMLVVNSERNNLHGNREETSITSTTEYVIITNEALSSSFVALRDWKTKKGVRTQIATVEDIGSMYTDATIQLKIKHYLKDLFQSQGIKYVLLGGDDSVVPVQRCYGIVNGSYEEYTIPTDLFYSCFSGAFDWDANGNSVFGEIGDNIDLTPSFFISRAPVRTVSDVSSFVAKTLNYEQKPSINGWNNNILMGGNKLWRLCTANSNVSDAQAKSGRLYNTSIAPYWQGDHIQFFDTYTDFPTGAGFQFSASNLQNVLSNGYTFVDIATHGNQSIWGMETYPNYSSDSAAILYNNIPTIISTMACLTNAFDTTQTYSSDPCLSEAFIRNPNNSVVAYLGSSREGWGRNSADSTLGPSLQYESIYYKLLFDTQIKEKNWGKIVALAKASKIPSSNTYGADRWIQFGLNAIGDPEMPVFTETPLEFTSVSISSLSNGFTLDTGVSGCKVCIMSCDDNGQSQYDVYDSIQYVTAEPLTQNVSVCITKPGFIPRTFYLSSQDIYVQNETLKNSSIYHGNKIYVGSNVTNMTSTGNVEAIDANIIMRGHEITISPGTIINSGVVFEAIGE